MANLSTSTTNFDKTVVVGVQRRIEELLRGSLVHLQDCTRGEWMSGNSETIRFISYPDIAVTVGTPTPGSGIWLTEGTAPTATAGTIDYEEMTAYQAGRVEDITDKAALLNPHDLIAIRGERLARHAARVVDTYISETVGAHASPRTTVYSGSSNAQTSDVAAGDIITGYNVKQAVAALAAAAVPRFPDGYYHAWIHPNVSMLGLMVDDDAGGWIDANKYTDNRPLLNGELGRYAGVRFMESPYTYVRTASGTSSIDVYDTVIYGPGAFGFGDITSIETFFNRGASKSDPLNQIAARLGWKAWFGAKVLTAAGAKYARIQSAGV